MDSKKEPKRKPTGDQRDPGGFVRESLKPSRLNPESMIKRMNKKTDASSGLEFNWGGFKIYLL
jgi:hypothetical protein